MSDVPQEPYESEFQEIPNDAKTLASLAHILGLFTWFVGPLLIWILKKDDHPFIEDQAKEALNFQITITLAHTISAILWCAVVGLFFSGAVFIFQVVMAIIATVSAGKGEYYRYPLTLRLVK